MKWPSTRYSNRVRHGDAKKWFTVAAEAGDTEAMRQLIEEYDQRDLVRCWTWVYLAKLMDEHYAITDLFGAPDPNRTGGPPLRRGMLYPLSYGGVAAGDSTAAGGGRNLA